MHAKFPISTHLVCIVSAIAFPLVSYIFFFELFPYKEKHIGSVTIGKISYLFVEFAVALVAVYGFRRKWLIVPCGPVIALISMWIGGAGGMVLKALGGENVYREATMAIVSIPFIPFVLLLAFVTVALPMFLMIISTGLLGGIGSAAINYSLTHLLETGNARQASPDPSVR